VTTQSLNKNTLDNTEPVFDKGFFESVTMGDPALQKEVIGLFTSQLDEAIVAVPALSSKEDWKLALHRLRGAALAVGAREMALYLGFLERSTLPPARAECDQIASRIAILAARFRSDSLSYG
jgi:hypothetical protein